MLWFDGEIFATSIALHCIMPVKPVKPSVVGACSIVNCSTGSPEAMASRAAAAALNSGQAVSRVQRRLDSFKIQARARMWRNLEVLSTVPTVCTDGLGDRGVREIHAAVTPTVCGTSERVSSASHFCCPEPHQWASAARLNLPCRRIAWLEY